MFHFVDSLFDSVCLLELFDYQWGLSSKNYVAEDISENPPNHLQMECIIIFAILISPGLKT